MNFFEQQDRAHRRTRVLLLLFGLAVLAIVAVMNLLALMMFGQAEPVAPGQPVVTGDFLRANLEVMIWTTVFTVGLIGLGSLYRVLSLAGGGGAVAREMGGTLVEGDTRDPLRRRLRNVVEEVAIASGVPVPEVYVLEQEQGINAFAAGYSPADAAVAVTRGALEKLNRDELQGVVAHEFGHILNGDMRLNIRLVGVLFGILVLALIGQRVMLAMRYSRNNRNAGGIIAAGLVLMIVGYIGLFFGRWIRASVSRQREFLADASAVQFTRQPQGIGGALKKIAAGGGALNADSEEVGHMLFSSGRLGQMFATHPPLEERIRAIEPQFDAQELEDIRKRLQREAQARTERAAEAAAEEEQREQREAGPGGLALNPQAMLETLGDPGLAQILGAGLLVAAMPGPLEKAAHSEGWAAEVLLYLLISGDADVRHRQLLQIAETRGADSETRVRNLLDAAPELAADQRIPLLEMSFPALRRLPPEERAELAELVTQLVHADGRVSVFEYALGRLVNRHLADLERPGAVQAGGRLRLVKRAQEACHVLAVLAHHGHPGDAEAARAAFGAGFEALSEALPVAVRSQLADPREDVAGPGWADAMDRALERLDGLRLADKERLVQAMLATITHGGRTVVAEVELLRAIAAAVHVPLPVAESPEAAGGE